MHNDNHILKDSIFKIGKVTSVIGRSITVKVDKTKNTSHLLFKGNLLKNISVGGYIKIIKGFTKIIGKVEGEYIKEEKGYFEKEYGSSKEKINRILNISLLGFLKDDCFERGIKELPLIDNECFLLENDEFNKVHDFIRKDDEPILIGALSLEKGQEIRVGVNSLFASHIGIFGNTGSGKSYTLAKIYRELFLKYQNNTKFQNNAHFFLLDFNNEYIRDDVIIEKKFKNIYKLSTKNSSGDKFPVHIDTINDPDFWKIFLTATEKTQSPFLERTLKKDDISNLDIEVLVRDIITNEDRRIDIGILYNFFELTSIFLAENINVGNLRHNLKYHSMANSYYYTENGKTVYANSDSAAVLKKIKSYLIREDYTYDLKIDLTNLEKIRLKIIFYHYREIINGYSNQEYIAPLVRRLEKKIVDLDKVITVEPDGDIKINGTPSSNERFFTIVSLKNVNPVMKKVLPLLICKQLYDEKKHKNKKDTYLNLIIDEAHNILSYTSERESESWKDYRLETFEEIIKEGRKFGVFLTIATQRPSDVSSTIISQLHNFFLHRLINNNDISAIERTISYLDKISIDSLSILPTGTCILTGLLAQVPVIVDIGKIDPIKHKPDNDTIELIKIWKDSLDDRSIEIEQ